MADSVRVASYNVMNLFSRPKVFGLGSWADGRPILDAYNRVTDLLEIETYIRLRSLPSNL
jgi:hypothetical protein